MDIPFKIDLEKVYSVDEISQTIRLERQTVIKEIKSGKIPAYKFGTRMYRIVGSDLMKYLENCFVEGNKK
jgi:excisionase family DNA binding protein